ncbi:MAG: hypothetical protein NW237_00570 [Cyanobacteriota bacterium]|nr:hypothetical protein [Cyanobacteriota bacterium]
MGTLTRTTVRIPVAIYRIEVVSLLLLLCLVPIILFWNLCREPIHNLWRYRALRAASRKYLQECLMEMPLEQVDMAAYLLKENPFASLQDYEVNQIWKREVERVLILHLQGKRWRVLRNF